MQLTEIFQEADKRRKVHVHIHIHIQCTMKHLNRQDTLGLDSCRGIVPILMVAIIPQY